jgi:four helix bundle protein
MQNHKDLEAWKVSVDFAVDVYRLTGTFPKEEIYGLTSQLRRASVSIPANIAEGAARNSTKEFIQFLHIALGSASEVETHLILAQKLGFADAIDPPLIVIERIKKLVFGLIKHCRSKTPVNGER